MVSESDFPGKKNNTMTRYITSISHHLYSPAKIVCTSWFTYHSPTMDPWFVELALPCAHQRFSGHSHARLSPSMFFSPPWICTNWSIMWKWFCLKLGDTHIFSNSLNGNMMIIPLEVLYFRTANRRPMCSCLSAATIDPWNCQEKNT